MDWSKQKILDTIKEIRRSSGVLTKHDADLKFIEFREQFPSLYNFCFDPSFDMQTIFHMLNWRDKTKNEGTSDFIRDVTISENLAKKYLYTQFPEPTVEQKKKAAEKILREHYDSNGNRKTI